MSIRKVKGLESDFTIVPNKAINDKLSWAARGMLLYLCSKSDNWEVNISDLVNQTEGSKKKSGRDAVRGIMAELIECGYMRKSQDRNIKGQFNNADHEVSFVPFTENPYTVTPTQESKDLTKVKKDQEPDNYSSNNRFYIGRLNQEDFDNCYKACDELTMYSGVFAGCLSIEEWETCEEAMRSVDEFNHIDYFEWWIGKYAKSFTKKPSLPNMLCDVNGISFDRFYEAVFLNEFE